MAKKPVEEKVENKGLHKTKLRLEMDKTIQPKQYEPIKIIVDIEETFCWKDEEDRTKKMKKYNDMISDDFVKCFNEVVTKLGEKDRCIGRVVVKNNKSDFKPTDKGLENVDEFDCF